MKSCVFGVRNSYKVDNNKGQRTYAADSFSIQSHLRDVLLAQSEVYDLNLGLGVGAFEHDVLELQVAVGYVAGVHV